MKLTLSCLQKNVSAAAACWVLALPVYCHAADRVNQAPRVAPLGMPVQQVNYNNNSGNGNCPNGNCYGNTSNWGGWNNNGWATRGWGGNCHSGHCWGGGCFGCQHGVVQGNSFVRPPAVWPVAGTPNTYQFYWGPQLTGAAEGGWVPGPAYPMIYHPTDTTQLGFYYKHVPRWGYRPQMLPPPPVPNWPLGQHTAYGAWSNGVVDTYGTTVPSTNVTTPVTPVVPPVESAPPTLAVPPVKVPPPPPEANLNNSDSNTAVFPDQVRE
ncbi:MAG: hypothetical protein JWM11_4709 [Planctomycetaceae bacterium]|nr:hypothetical protein [Planctomycetaceae bacterium]